MRCSITANVSRAELYMTMIGCFFVDDSTRVILNNEEDYINANHMQKPMGKNCFNYIASQGPLPNTTGDFWEMIMEQGVTVIAMVTQDIEVGKVKCHRYWPDTLHTQMIIDQT